MRPLLIVLALALAACTAVPTVPLQAQNTAKVSGFATLAQWGTWEYELAPAYTRLAVVRHQAARALEAGKITVGTAIAIQAEADQTRRLLDASRRGNAKEPTALQRTQHAEALDHLGAAETLLETKP